MSSVITPPLFPHLDLKYGLFRIEELEVDCLGESERLSITIVLLGPPFFTI